MTTFDFPTDTTWFTLLHSDKPVAIVRSSGIGDTSGILRTTDGGCYSLQDMKGSAWSWQPLPRDHIVYLRKDVTQFNERLLIHGCNAQGAMNSGVAKAIRERFPKAWLAYKHAFEMGQHDENVRKLTQLGNYIDAPVSPNRTVINAITQQNYGKDGKKYVSYDAIDQVTKRIAVDYDVPTCAMPKIGCGLGGGDWSIVEAIIKNNLTPAMQVVVYEL